MDLLLPWILAHIIDEVVPRYDMAAVLRWGLAMLVCAVLAAAGNITANRMAAAVARDTTRSLRNDLFEKIQKLSCRQFGGFTESSLISRMTSDTYNVHHVIGMMQRLGVRAPLLLLGGIIITMTLDKALALILVAMLPLLGVTVWFVSKKGIPMYKLHQQAADNLVRKVRESISGIRVIKALSKTEYEKEQFEAVNSEVVSRETGAGVTMAVTNPVMNFLLNMGWVLIILVGAYRVDAGLTQPGSIIAFLTYFTIILNAMLSITRLFVMYSKAGSSMARIAAVLETCDDLPVLDDEGAEGQHGGYHIEFEHVTFSYNGKKGCNQLEDISFALKRGQTLGIIGATGSGKSTIVNLLLRLYDTDSGTVRINGRDIRSYSHDELDKMFGAVFQYDTVFEASVAENITLGRDIMREDVKKAAECAQISEHIDKMPEGFESMVAIKGANLSGGQKQRLLIARALAGSPEVLILDDSSSALDYKTDAAVRANIQDEYKDTTTIIVAQRVSSVRNADLIIVLDEGRIIGMGTHSELLESCGEYMEISRLQLGSVQLN